MTREQIIHDLLALKEFFEEESGGAAPACLDEAAELIKEISKPRGEYECFHCLQKTVIWDSDFDFSDYGYEGEGIVHNCHCTNCGAEIEYRIPINTEEEDGG